MLCQQHLPRTDLDTEVCSPMQKRLHLAVPECEDVSHSMTHCHLGVPWTALDEDRSNAQLVSTVVVHRNKCSTTCAVYPKGTHTVPKNIRYEWNGVIKPG